MTVWNTEVVAEMRRLRDEGYSSSQIASALTKLLNTEITRNAVMGKLHRLGLSSPVDLRAQRKSRTNPFRWALQNQRRSQSRS